MSLLDTVRQEIRANGIGNFDSFENRKQRNGLLQTALAFNNSPMSVTNAIAADVNAGNYGVDKKIIALNKDDTAAGDTRTCSPAGGESTSALYTVTRNVATFDITMYPSEYGQNDVAFQQDLARKLYNAENALAKKIDGDLYTNLDSAKNLTYDSPFVGAGKRYELTAGTLQVEETRQDFFFNDLKSIVMAENVEDQLFVVGDAQLMSYYMKYSNQGGQNAANLNFQFNGYGWNFSNSVATTAGKSSTGFAMPVGSYGVLMNNTPDSVAGRTAGNKSWSTMTLPQNLLGQAVSVYEVTDCADASSLGSSPVGLENTYKMDIQLSIDYHIITPYSSDANKAPIYKFDFE